MPARVLVVDDEVEIRRVLRAGLSAQGYSVETAGGGLEALTLIAQYRPDVILLDLNMPDLQGTEVIRQVRTWSKIPIIVLSVQGLERDKVDALNLGADDYLTKPFGIEELVARIRVALRRAGGTEPIGAIFRTADLSIDLEKRLVTMAGREVALSPTEYGVLKVLAQHAGKVLTHRALLQAVWGPNYRTEDHYLHVYIRRLRQKLEPDPANPRYFITEPGAGYRLTLE